MFPDLRQCLRMALGLGLMCVFIACAAPAPTPTPKPTQIASAPAPILTPTHVATATPTLACPNEMELAYFKEVQRFFKITGESATKVGNLFAVMDESVDWAIDVTVEFLTLKEAANHLLDLSPPPSAKSISEPTEMAARLIRFGINNIVDGLTNSDAFAIETGATLFEQATGEIQKASLAVAAYCE